jgi:hypothetical protein
MAGNVYKTANGKTLDMRSLALKNEQTRAVGNMKVNARGDIINDAGLVTHAKPQQVQKQYNQQVQTRKGHKG